MARAGFALLALVLVAGLTACGATTGPNDPTIRKPVPNTVEGTTTTTTTSGGEAKGDAAAGKTLFAAQPCGGCHTLADAGTKGTVGPNLDEANPPYDLVVERVTNGAGAMPSFKGQLSAKQIQDLAAYVSSVAGE